MRGLRAFRSHPSSRKQRSDLVTLAHIHCPAGELAKPNQPRGEEQSCLSLGSYGGPRMTEELKN